MVRIVDYKVRLNANGEPFNALIAQGGIELVKSKETGFYYAKSLRASIPSTLDEKTCKSLIGHELEGSIQKVKVEPFEVTNQDTGEVITLDHSYQFFPEDEAITMQQEEELLELEAETV